MNITNCPNCNNPLVYKPLYGCCNQCEILIFKSDYEDVVSIYYQRLNIKVSLLHNLTLEFDITSTFGNISKLIKRIPEKLDMQSVVNFMAIAETFE